jgi:hypothetical protein
MVTGPVEVNRKVWIPRAAEWIVAQHRDHGTCPHCRDRRCDSVTWAQNRLATYDRQ